MNKVILVGRLTKDPELRTTTNGKSVATFTVAIDRKFKQDGQPDADFFNIVAWGRQAEVISQYLGKGRQIALIGRIQTRSYEAQDGSKRYITEIILEEFDFIGSKQNNEASAPSHDAPVQTQGNNQMFDLGDDDFYLKAEDNDLPF